MHILVTNDDGPPSPQSSPYVHALIRHLQNAGHTVSVCLPAGQRSWIGKAHMIGQTVKPTYYRPSTTFDPSLPADAAHRVPQGTTHSRPTRNGEEEWILVDGTPASAAQIGLHHFFAERGPVDLVVSGPNYGRNTTAVFALSSGTLGGALEAAVCRRKAIALSFAFFTRNHDPAIIDGACAHSVRVVEALYRQWPADGSVDLYTVNVPLIEGVGEKKILWTNILQNYWGSAEEGGSSCFQEVEGSVGDEDEEEERIRESEAAVATGVTTESEEAKGEERYPHRHFKWAPKFTDVYKSVDEAPPGNDGWAVKEGFTSVTPLKASFFQAATHLHGTEFQLSTMSQEAANSTRLISLPHRPKGHFYGLIAYEDPYVQPLILAALAKVFPPEAYTLLSLPDNLGDSEVSLRDLLPNENGKIVQITPYETLDFEYAAMHPKSSFINSYMLRKALIRKHYLASTVQQWLAKNPTSCLKEHVKDSENFEVDYAEFLDDALVESWNLQASMEKNMEAEREGKDREWWILKPGMSDRGQGIRLFSTMEELQGIFDQWEEERPDSDEEDEEEAEGENEVNDDNGATQPPPAASAEGQPKAVDETEREYITTSHLRHFVAQPYIHPPLLLDGDDRKFHIRTYVLCVGSLDVYVYRDMLALFAGKAYVPPWNDAEDLEAHLTNTCLQRSVHDGTVQRFWDIKLADGVDGPSAGPQGEVTKQHIFKQICQVTGEVFEAAARGMMMHFRPLPNAFEVYGLDYLVDAAGTAWLLEVNAYPDFKQTGEELRGLVAELWEGVLRLAVRPFVDESSQATTRDETSGGQDSGKEKFVHVRRVELGSPWG